jgi:hypothetical protein
MQLLIGLLVLEHSVVFRHSFRAPVSGRGNYFEPTRIAWPVLLQPLRAGMFQASPA